MNTIQTINGKQYKEYQGVLLENNSDIEHLYVFSNTPPKKGEWFLLREDGKQSIYRCLDVTDTTVLFGDSSKEVDKNECKTIVTTNDEYLKSLMTSVTVRKSSPLISSDKATNVKNVLVEVEVTDIPISAKDHTDAISTRFKTDNSKKVNILTEIETETKSEQDNSLVRGKPLTYWKTNAEEDYITAPISVLKYITVLEEALNQKNNG